MTKFINLLIPCAGQSKRFFDKGYKLHKSFLQLENELNILFKIINSFDSEIFKPHLIFTYEQFDIYEKEINDLKDNFRELVIHKIHEHSLGPTYSIKQIDIPEAEPVVVHYCDFLTKFDHKNLIQIIHDGDIAAPYFNGFHPASLGTTNFAYMIIDSTEELVNLQEKKPYTSNRISEPASTGIYAFPSFKLFLALAESLFKNKKKWAVEEAYTSLLLNEAIEKGLQVKCIKVKNFICLGTPRDYEEYLYWNKLYLNFKANNKKSFKNNIHLITAAGLGSRFKDQNFRLPKIFNKFFDNCLLDLSIRSLKDSFTHILLLDELNRYIPLLKESSRNNRFTSVDKTPDGQLISLNTLIKKIELKESFFVSSADYAFDINEELFRKFVKEKSPDIIIFTTKWLKFVNESIENYGFVYSDTNSKILKIIEKPNNIINSNFSNNLLIGTFWFKNKEIVKTLPLSKNHKESFIALAINEVLKNYKVYNFKVNYWLSLGTPKEFNLGKYWFDYFENEKR